MRRSNLLRLLSRFLCPKYDFDIKEVPATFFHELCQWGHEIACRLALALPGLDICVYGTDPSDGESLGVVNCNYTIMAFEQVKCTTTP